MSLSNLIGGITGRGVLLTGMIGAAVSALLLPVGSSLGVLAALFLPFLLLISVVDNLLSHLLSSFAEVPAWPRFVCLGIAIVIAAHVGGWRADVVIAFLLTAMDGNVFDALY